jgi:hypothetical protein
MPSPFPGMDPYLEGHLWPDVHHGLAAEIRRRLAPRLRPRYVARIEINVVEDENPEAEIGIMYPDVEVLKPVGLRIASVEIRDAAGDQLVTTIEILSPVNKREPGLRRCRDKRERLRRAGVHVIEIDLLRRGTRAPSTLAKPPASNYLITLTWARAPRVEFWPVRLSDPLPTVPVPLREPDPDVPLELSPALSAIYEEAVYELSVDYRQAPPPPALTPEEERWMRDLLERR